jgi:hypothetical protein
MQFVGAALDCCLAMAAFELCLQRHTEGEKDPAAAPLAWGLILLVVATFL